MGPSDDGPVPSIEHTHGERRCAYCGSQCWHTLAMVALDAWTIVPVKVETCEGCDALTS